MNCWAHLTNYILFKFLFTYQGAKKVINFIYSFSFHIHSRSCYTFALRLSVIWIPQNQPNNYTNLLVYFIVLNSLVPDYLIYFINRYRLNGPLCSRYRLLAVPVLSGSPVSLSIFENRVAGTTCKDWERDKNMKWKEYCFVTLWTAITLILSWSPFISSVYMI